MIQVMEPVSRPEPFDDPAFLFQLKWDGLRMLAILPGNEGPVILQNRRGRTRTGAYPELGRLSLVLPGREAIFDGEVVVLREGRPSFQAVMRRELGGPGGGRLQSHPIRYMVFDLLWLDGEDLRARPLEERLLKLKSLLEPRFHWGLVESHPGQGKRLFQAVEAEGLEGIVAKRLGSPYTPGKKSDAWIKVKCFRAMPCVVAGYTLKGPRPSALIVGAYRDQELVYLGRVGSGLSQGELDRLAGLAVPLQTDRPPFAGFPLTPGVQFLRPVLVGKVKYLEWTEDGRFRAPVWEGFIDLPPEECQL